MRTIDKTRLALLTLGGSSALAFAQEVKPGEKIDPIVQLHAAIEGKLAQTEIDLYQKAALSVATLERTTPDGTEVGCGFFIDDKGTFVTVLATAGDTLQMKLNYGGRDFLPQLLTMDPYTRLAVMTIKDVKPPGLELAPSRGLELGDYLIAVAETPDEGNRCTIGRLAGREKNFDGVPQSPLGLVLSMELGLLCS